MTTKRSSAPTEWKRDLGGDLVFNLKKKQIYEQSYNTNMNKKKAKVVILASESRLKPKKLVTAMPKC